MSMNRQLRRAQEKQEKKLEKDKEERRAERRRRLDQLRAQRRKRAEDAVARRRSQAGAKGKDGKDAAPAAAGKPSPNDPGRFSGAFAIATVFFIIIQGVVPTETDQSYESFVKAGFYLMLGYFLTLWLLRRQHAQAFVLSLLAGVILLTGTWLGFLMRPDAVLDPLAMILSLPLLLVGAWLARLVYNMAQRQNEG